MKLRDTRDFRTVRTAPGRTERLRRSRQPAGSMGFVMLERLDGSTREFPEAKWNAAARSAR